MKTKCLILFVFLLTQCVPVSTYTSRDIATKSYFNDPQGRVQVFQNQQLEAFNLSNYASFQIGARQDPNIIPFAPYNYQYILDTLILRWEIPNPSISYNLSIQDIFDKQYAKLALDMPAILISTISIEKLKSAENSGFLIFNFVRTNYADDFNNSRTMSLRPEEQRKRNDIRNRIHSISSTQEKAYVLASLGYHLDALTLIELELSKKENSKLVSVYWNIVNELLTNTPPNLNR